MRDTDCVSELRRVEAPWKVTEAALDRERGRVNARIAWQGPGKCPTCGIECPKHDHRERTWRDLDLCADKLYLTASVPRVDCPERGVITVDVQWASGRNEFTSRFERLAIALLSEMSISGVSRRLSVSWDQIDGIMGRAVTRGLQRRQIGIVRYIGIDEKAVKKGHKYFTIVSDLESGTVLWIGRDRKQETLKPFWNALSSEQINGIEGIAMDMWLPYFESTIGHIPHLVRKIVFAKFHITSHLTN